MLSTEQPEKRHRAERRKLVPVHSDQNGALDVAGHHRVRAGKELVIDDYPVIVRTYA